MSAMCDSITIFDDPNAEHVSHYNKSRPITHREFCEFEKQRFDKDGHRTHIATDPVNGQIALCHVTIGSL
jgi:hypothetical protein